MKKAQSIPGIKDIARIAGVSIGTVDRVLHNRGRAAEETRKKVLEIAEQLNYRPNLIARSLVTRRPRTLALLIPDQEDSYWRQAWEGVARASDKWIQHGITTENHVYSLESRESFNAAALKVIARKPDGIILAPNFLEEGRVFSDKCRKISVPVVMFDTYVPGSEPLSIIGTDSYESGMVAAELLHKTARRKGWFVLLHFDEEPGNSPHMLEKERGFEAYLRKECPKRKYEIVAMNNARRSYNSELKALFGSRKISGVFVSTSRTYRIGSFLAKEGIGKIRLVGYDLTDENIKLLRSGHIDFLINQNPELQAEESINKISEYLVFGTKPHSRINFPLGIVTRTNLKSFLQE